MNSQERRLVWMVVAMFFFSFLPVQAFSSTVIYKYDAAGRLTSANYSVGNSIAYTYDASGNLLKREIAEAVTIYVSTGNCGGKGPCYHTLAEAVSAAGDNSLIKVAGEVFAGYTVDEGKSLTFEWGYNPEFTSNTGVTEIRGSFTAKDRTVIRSGTVRAK